MRESRQGRLKVECFLLAHLALTYLMGIYKQKDASQLIIYIGSGKMFLMVSKSLLHFSADKLYFGKDLA